MEKKQGTKSEILQMIIEEVDAAREVHQLFEQFQKALPIRSFDDLRKAADKEGNLQFRDATVNYSYFENFIPEFIFPIEDERGLVLRLAQFVKLMPEHLGYDTEKPENVKKYAQLQFLSTFFGKVNTTGILSQNFSRVTDSNTIQEMIRQNTGKEAKK